MKRAYPTTFPGSRMTTPRRFAASCVEVDGAPDQLVPCLTRDETDRQAEPVACAY
jgi:hypothetical protein